MKKFVLLILGFSAYLGAQIDLGIRKIINPTHDLFIVPHIGLEIPPEQTIIANRLIPSCRLKENGGSIKEILAENPFFTVLRERDRLEAGVCFQPQTDYYIIASPQIEDLEILLRDDLHRRTIAFDLRIIPLHETYKIALEQVLHAIPIGQVTNDTPDSFIFQHLGYQEIIKGGETKKINIPLPLCSKKPRPESPPSTYLAAGDFVEVFRMRDALNAGLCIRNEDDVVEMYGPEEEYHIVARQIPETEILNLRIIAKNRSYSLVEDTSAPSE